MYRINTSNLTVTMPKATALDRDYSSQAENIARNLHIYCGPFPSPKKKKQQKKQKQHPATSRALDVQISLEIQHIADEISAESQKDFGSSSSQSHPFSGGELC